MKQFLIIILVWITESRSYEPKSKEIFCPPLQCFGKPHIYCDGVKPDHNGILGHFPQKIILSDDQKQLILDKHNEFRNILATGEPKLTNLAGEIFPRAQKMHKIVWNEELEWMAGLNAETCAFEHDCPSTHTFNIAGQNLAFEKRTDFINGTEFLGNSVKNWFAEYLNTPIDVIDGYDTRTVKSVNELSKEEISKVRQIASHEYGISMNGHFTTLVNDETSKVGCSFYSCGQVDDFKSSLYVVCNYEMINMMGEQIYSHNMEDIGNCNKSSKFCELCLDSSDIEESVDNQCFKSDLNVPFFYGESSRSSIAIFSTFLFMSFAVILML